MEKNLFGFPILYQQLPSNLKSLCSLSNSEQQSSVPVCMKPYLNEFFPNGALPAYMFPELPGSRISQLNGMPSRFDCLPCFSPPFDPLLNHMPKERLPVGKDENIRGHENLAFGNLFGQKQFLIFDQCGNQAPLIYSSGIGSVPCSNFWNPKQIASSDWLTENFRVGLDRISPSGPCLGPLLNDECERNQKHDIESEMHEDTEELDAFLYSDDDNYYSEDDDEQSTGHSPSTMTANKIQDWIADKDEVASCAGSTKRQKLFDGGYKIPSVVDNTALMDTASSFRCAAPPELEGDAESSCGKDSHVPREFSSFSERRSTRQNIHETIRTLQSMIPDGKGKDAADIIDEAIHYLRSLKAKAKKLGLDIHSDSMY